MRFQNPLGFGLIRLRAPSQDPKGIAAPFHEGYRCLQKTLEVRLVQCWLPVCQILTLEDVDQACVFDVVESHKGGSISHIIVEARGGDVSLDFQVRSRRNQ